MSPYRNGLLPRSSVTGVNVGSNPTGDANYRDTCIHKQVGWAAMKTDPL